jgi:hypothetical protein
MPNDIMTKAYQDAKVGNKCILCPDLKAGETLEDFQVVAAAASLMSEQRLIFLHEPPHRESQTGHRYIDAIYFTRLV